MSVLLDTSALYGFLQPSDDHHGEAKDLFLRIAHGETGAAYVADWVVAELFTLIRGKREPPRLEESAHRMLPFPDPSPIGVRLATLAPSQLEQVWRIFERHRSRRVSFIDAAQLVLMEIYRIDRLATFDRTLDALAKGTKKER